MGAAGIEAGLASEEAIDVTPSPLAIRGPSDAIAEFSQDGIGIERIRKLAHQITEIIEEQHLAVQIGRGKHLRVEAWCAIGALVGVSPRTEGHPLAVLDPETGELLGYEATVEAIRIATGEVIGRAVAGCYADEEAGGRERWKENGRPNRHAILSMAQTRATSKALGQVLRFVPVMAGFSGTPFEEMPPGGYDSGPPPAGPSREEMQARQDAADAQRAERSKAAPKKKAAAKPAAARATASPNASEDDRISEGKAKRLWAIAFARAREFGEESITGQVIVRSVFDANGLERTEDLHWKKYDGIIEQIQNWDPPGIGDSEEEAPF